jgi:hypothetical protein
LSSARTAKAFLYYQLYRPVIRAGRYRNFTLCHGRAGQIPGHQGEGTIFDFWRTLNPVADPTQALASVTAALLVS